MNQWNHSSDETHLTVMEETRILTFSYEQIMNYHGGAMPAGVALAFRLFEHLFPVYEARAGHPPIRSEATFYSGLGENGQGILDTADILLRIRKYNTLLKEPPIPCTHSAPQAPGGGNYYFCGVLGEMTWTATLRDGLIPPGFYNASREMHYKKQNQLPITQEDIRKLQELRQDTEKALLTKKPEEIFDFGRM